MNPERTSKWNDSRLDEAFETLRSEIRALRDVPAKLAEFAVELRTVKQDTGACHAAVREMRDDFQAYVEEQAQAREAHRLEQAHTREAHRIERKTDRRWMIGTVLTSAALVVAAMSLLLGHLG